MAQVVSEKIHLVSMQMLEFSIQAGGKPSQNAYNLKQRVTIEHDPELTFLRVGLSVSCSQVSDEAASTSASGTFRLLFFFTVDNLSELMVESAGNPFPIPDPQLAGILTGIAYSTARGVLWARIAGTPLEGFVLPVVNPLQLLVESSQVEA